MQNTLNRNLINPNIGYVEFTGGKPKDRDYMFSRINKIKQLLVKNGAKRGDFMNTFIVSPSIDGICSYLAGAELGLMTYSTDNTVWHDMDSDGKETGRMYYEDRSIVQQAVHPSLDPSTPEFRVSDMLSPVGKDGLVKGDLFAGTGKKWHFGDGIAKKDVCHILFSEIDDMPDEDIQPWDVSDDDFFYVAGYTGEDMVNVTQRQVLSKARDCVDIFDFTDKKVAMTKTQHHHFSFELSILPCLMVARKIFELPVMQMSRVQSDAKVNEREMMGRNVSVKQLSRHGVEVVWGIDEGDIPTLRSLKENENMRIIQHEGTDYWNFDVRPRCL